MEILTIQGSPVFLLSTYNVTSQLLYHLRINNDNLNTSKFNKTIIKCYYLYRIVLALSDLVIQELIRC